MSLASTLAFLAAAVVAKLRPGNPDAEATKYIAELECELVKAKRATEAAHDQRDTLLNELARWQAVADSWRSRYDVVVDELVMARGAAMRDIRPAVLAPGGGGGGGGVMPVIRNPLHDDGFWNAFAAEPHPNCRSTIEPEERLTAEEVLRATDALVRCNCVPSRAQVWAATQ
jgi:hypothetical protein